MKRYIVKTVTGQVLSVIARRVDFGPGHVSFWTETHLVRALRTSFVAEVTEDSEP